MAALSPIRRPLGGPAGGSIVAGRLGSAVQAGIGGLASGAVGSTAVGVVGSMPLGPAAVGSGPGVDAPLAAGSSALGSIGVGSVSDGSIMASAGGGRTASSSARSLKEV
jgi:hypothetical protein